MKFSLRPIVAVLLFGSSATLLTACDYKYSPGVNMQFQAGFSNPKGYTNADINRDSINYKQTVTKPIGLGSATANKNGSVNDQLNSAPAGDNTTSPQTASGQMGSTDQNMSASTSPKSTKKSSGSSK